MSNNTFNSIFENFCFLNQKVQNIETQLLNQTITPNLRVELHKRIESLQGKMEALRQKAFGTQKQARQLFKQFEEMESQIISLYRKVEERFEDFEISLISKGAIDLSQSLTKGKMVETAKKVHELRHNVHFLFKHRRPSLGHRKVIHLAMKITDHVDETLAMPGKISKKQLQWLQLLKMLLLEAIKRADEPIALPDSDLSMELYEIADLFYHKKEKEARLRLCLIRAALKSSQQTRLEASWDRPTKLAQILLEIADGDPCIEWEEKKSGVICELHA